MKRAADTLTPVSLELGGKDPAIVLADADMDRAVNACAYGGFVEHRPGLMSIERIYVEEPVYDVFVNRLADSVRELRQGADGRSYHGRAGCDDLARADRDRLRPRRGRPREGRAHPHRRQSQGRPRRLVRADVIADADHSMKVMRDETFGPVVGVMKVNDAGEAIRMANNTATAFPHRSSRAMSTRAEKVAEQLEVGAANINDALINYFHLEVPMGGWKDSGIGWRHGPGGIEVLPDQTIVSPRMKNTKSEPLWYPYTPGRRKLDEPALPAHQRARPEESLGHRRLS